MIRVVVKGRVQGVGFRATTQAVASRLGLHGYVQNLEDGSVEIGVVGKQEAKQLLEALNKEPGAHQIFFVNIEETNCQPGPKARLFSGIKKT
jgi:acylphosphatase